MFRIEITGNSADEVRDRVVAMAALLGSTSGVALSAAQAEALRSGGKGGATAALDASAARKTNTEGEGTLTEAEARKIAAGTATIVPPNAKAKAAAAAKAAAEAAAAEAAAAEAAQAEEDPLGEAAVDETTAYTKADVTAALVEMRNARTDKPSLTAEIVKEAGAAKLADVDPSKYPMIMARAAEELAKAKK